MNPGFFDRVKVFFQMLMESSGVKDEPPKDRKRKKTGALSASSEIKENPGNEQSGVKRTTLFCDVEIAGEKENGQSTPNNPSTEIPNAAGIERERRKNIQQDKFIADMHLFAGKEGTAAEFVSCDGGISGYDELRTDQLNLYFCWRSEVRAGRYPDTSPEYILIHAQEILNGCVWEKEKEGLDCLVKLWTNYRARFPQIDQKLFGWTFDFAREHQLDFAPDQIAEIPEKIDPAVRNLLIDRHRKDKPLKLSMSLVKEISAYSVRDSRFCMDGYRQLLEEAAPRVIALADAALLKKKGRGILQQYGPRVGKKQRYRMYADAAHPLANRSVEVTVRAYENAPQLRQYVGELIRHAENVLREMRKYRGRLRVEGIDPETAALIEGFLKKEYALDRKKESVETGRAELHLNFDSIDALRIQSDAVREALEVVEETESHETESTIEPLEDKAEKIIPDSVGAGNGYFDVDKLSGRMRSLLEMLAEIQQAALFAVLVSEGPVEQLTILAEEAFTMPEILIDEINDAAMQALDDILIEILGDAPCVLEQYEAELRDAIINGG